MSNEHVRYSHQGSEDIEDQYDQKEEVLWRNSEVRKAAKDLLLNAEELPESEPYRAELIKTVGHILSAVPILDPKREARDERDRQQLADSINRYRQQ